MVIKGCNRCGGDLYDEEAIGQVDLVCLQCGFRRTLMAGGHAASPEEAERAMRSLQAERPRASARS